MSMALLMWLSVFVLCTLKATTYANMQCIQQQKNSYLWKVDVQPPIYFFGTMHVPYTTLWNNIPSNAKTAFSGSDDLCLELKLSEKSTQDTLANCQLLPEGQTVSNVLATDLIKKIKIYFQKIRQLLPNWLGRDRSSWIGRGRSFSDRLLDAMIYNWEKKRPIWILMLLSSLTEENIRLRNVPVLDQFLDNAAGKMNKTVQALETVDDQCRPLNRLTNQQVETVLRIQLEYLEALTSGPPNTVDEELEAYSCGNFLDLVQSKSMLPLPPLSNISNITLDEMNTLKVVDAFLYRQLITRRNRRMTKKLDQLLQRPRDKVYYVALGAGHLIGKKSIIHRLKKRRYIIQHIEVNQTIEGPELPSNIIELGDPSSVPKLLELKTPEKKQPTPQQGSNLATLGPDALRDVFNKIFGTGSSANKRDTWSLRDWLYPSPHHTPRDTAPDHGDHTPS